MKAIQRALWSLRAYAGLIVATALVLAVGTGGSQGWANVFWAVAFGIAGCTGNRGVWWLVVAVNAVALALIPVLVDGAWIAIPLSLIAFALLLAPESRRYVFENEVDPR